VALSGTREEALKKVQAEIGGESVILPTNLSDAAAVDALVPQAVEALGKLDILVNNAGVTRDNLAMRMKDEEWSDVIRINLEAAFRLCRAAMKPMMRAKYGRIISVTSVVGTTGNPGQANYAASKAGLVGMSKAMAQEVASRGITVNCIAPGFITSPMTEALPDAWKDPGGKAGFRKRYRCRCRLPGQPGGRVHDGPDAARQWRDGDALRQRPATCQPQATAIGQGSNDST
jgi:3-oxoacyl-[acyl-carrier protein] reductase